MNKTVYMVSEEVVKRGQSKSYTLSRDRRARTALELHLMERPNLKLQIEANIVNKMAFTIYGKGSQTEPNRIIHTGNACFSFFELELKSLHCFLFDFARSRRIW